MKSKLLLPALLLACSAALMLNSCSKSGSAAGDTAASASTGQGGSLAKFTIVGDYLYGVDNHYLQAFSLSDPAVPRRVYGSALNFDIETIYAYGGNLFLGTRTGLYIYSLTDPAQPRLTGEAHHARSCDPVVANDSIAFVTLRGSSFCGPATSGLYVHNVIDITRPTLIKTVPLPDPLGLGLQDSILYVCCQTAGLKVFDVQRPSDPVLLTTVDGADFMDVIPYNGILICYVRDGIVLYDISNPARPVLLKRIPA